MTKLVFHEKHLGYLLLLEETDDVTRTLIVILREDCCCDNSMLLRFILLRFNIILDAVEILILDYRDDAVFINLISVAIRTTVAEDICTSLLLIELDVHLRLNPRDDVEVCIDDILSVKLLLLIDHAARYNSLQELEYFFLLVLTLDITLCTGIIAGNICKLHSYLLERCVMYATDYYGYPVTRLVVDPLRSIIDVLLFSVDKIEILDTIFSSMCEISLFKGLAVCASLFKAIIKNAVNQLCIVLCCCVAVKNVMLHFFCLLFVI